MEAACETLSSDASLRAVILTGAAGPPNPSPSLAGLHLGGGCIGLRRRCLAFIVKIHLACKVLRSLPVLVIPSVNGHALAAYLEIMAACYLRICTAGSVFGIPQVKVGIPSVVEAAL